DKCPGLPRRLRRLAKTGKGNDLTAKYAKKDGARTIHCRKNKPQVYVFASRVYGMAIQIISSY
ncbi:MAG: hypothetical protein FWF47_05270, partial [Clostridia bacterium]|nr:hypothetical protein [Clostridia bacterium]